MFAYTYNPETYEYIGAVETELDPLETELQGKEIWLLPADSTFIAPLEAKDGFAVCWNGKAWEYIEDHRGTKYWPADATWETSPVEMKDLGPLPESALLERPEKPQSVLDQEKREAIQAKLTLVDAKSTRSLRAVVAGTATEDDKAYLAGLEQEAARLRAELAALES